MRALTDEELLPALVDSLQGAHPHLPRLVTPTIKGNTIHLTGYVPSHSLKQQAVQAVRSLAKQHGLQVDSGACQVSCL